MAGRVGYAGGRGAEDGGMGGHAAPGVWRAFFVLASLPLLLQVAAYLAVWTVMP